MNWNDAAAQMESIVSPIFDTMRFRLRPMGPVGVDVNAKPIEDLNRAALEFAGFMDLGPSKDEIPRHLSGDPNVRGTSVSYDGVITALTNAWPVRARKGDQVIVIVGNEQIAAGSEWAIAAHESDGSPREAFYVNRWKKG